MKKWRGLLGEVIPTILHGRYLSQLSKRGVLAIGNGRYF